MNVLPLLLLFLSRFGIDFPPEKLLLPQGERRGRFYSRAPLLTNLMRSKRLTPRERREIRKLMDELDS